MGDNKITIGELKRPEPRVIRILQRGTTPPRPKWMEGEPGYVESVAETCPRCGSVDVWRGPWCTRPEFLIRLVRMSPPVRHSGRARHSACLSCGEFRTDIQAIPYGVQDEEEA